MAADDADRQEPSRARPGGQQRQRHRADQQDHRDRQQPQREQKRTEQGKRKERPRERRARKSPRGYRQAQTLSTDQVVRVGIVVADAEGPQAVTMRRIASELGAGVMSLYWHVDDKNELLALMLDAIQGEVEMPDPPTEDWRTDLRSIAHNTRNVLRRHPWVSSVSDVSPPTGPNFLRHTDLTLAALDDLGLSVATMMNIATAVDTYVTGFVVREVREERTRHRNNDEQTPTEEVTLFTQIVDDHYPRLARVFQEGIDPDSAESVDERFQFGLESLLDGIAARITNSG